MSSKAENIVSIEGEAGKVKSLLEEAKLNGIVVIVKTEDYPKTFLDKQALTRLLKVLYAKLDSIQIGEFGPQFQYNRLKKGFWKVKCVNEESAEWLRNAISNIVFKKKRLILVSAAEHRAAYIRN